MRKTVYFFTVLFIFFTVIVTQTGCSNDNVSSKKEIKEQTKNVKENESLIGFLEQSGNFINSHRIPTLISADDVRANLKKYLVIDIRRHNDYVEGHIDGAINVAPSDLVAYMKNKVAAGTYDKIVMVCYSGHRASFSSMMLQLLGYSNVYSMKWGMSSWDKNTANKKWIKRISDKYSLKLETSDNPKSEGAKLPEIHTGKILGYDILEARVDTVLKKLKFEIGVDKLMENPTDYYIVNYWPVYNYKKGHLPGSVQYTPKQSLIRTADLLTLPTDKIIVVYDYTGQHASFVAAYLQVLGYDAYALTYGANSFMHSKLTSLQIGHTFDKTQVKEYPMIQGELPSLKTAGPVVDNSEEDNAPVPIIKKKNRKEEEEGGC
jgi:rhodanese-related sulfurtransferase